MLKCSYSLNTTTFTHLRGTRKPLNTYILRGTANIYRNIHPHPRPRMGALNKLACLCMFVDIYYLLALFKYVRMYNLRQALRRDENKTQVAIRFFKYVFS